MSSQQQPDLPSGTAAVAGTATAQPQASKEATQLPQPTTSSKELKKKYPTLTIGCSFIALVFALAIFRFFILDSKDPHQCQSLLNTGRWLDADHKQWQPQGCMLHPYSKKDVNECLQGRHVVFIGDSTVRQVFYATVKHVDPSISTLGEKHSDRTFTLPSSLQLSFFWDPFLNSTNMDNLLDGKLIGEAGTVPTMAVVGSGIWYLRHSESGSGGIPQWEQRMNALFDSVQPGHLPAERVVADEVVLMPVERAVESRLSPERAATLHNSDIQRMNDHLDHLLHESRNNPTKLAIPRVFNTLIEGLEGETEDGLHFSESVAKVQAQVLLNLRCNEAHRKVFPFDRTCCSAYPAPNWVQVLLLVFGLVWAPVGLWLVHKGDTPSSTLRFFPPQKYLVPLSIFSFSVTFLFLADRTSLFLKENKQYTALSFAVLSLASLLAGYLTLTPPDKDLGFLNRDQTDEWKGWMQVAILIYHYVGASKISGIYNPIRVLVAAYLFQTGYGHLTFFYKKGDFGFKRVAGVLVRLNLLTIVLAYLMKTDYLSYYFSPLVTIWFLIIWVTMWAFNSYNKSLPFLISKLVVGSILAWAYFSLPGPLEASFKVINAVFATEWNATEWRFRVTLDMWIVWVGMGTALLFIKIKEWKWEDRPEWDSWKKYTVWASWATLVGYMVFELTRASKFVYNAYHPYVSIFPVLAFCVVRNATPYLRSTSSKFFIFFGQCSLETFIIQFHLFIAGDTRGIIMMIPGGAWLRPLNFAITSIVFVFVSDQTAKATGSLTEWICAVPKPNTARPPPASGGGGGEYVALSTTGDGPGEAGEKPDTAAMMGGGGGGSRGGFGGAEGLWNKVAGWAERDLRIRFAFFFVGLWVLNEIYPATK
ncbi:Cas1p-domain-containing protein [Meredithblackwellia eburnea MCA 4105]